MDQLTDYSDSRNKSFCIHYGSGLKPDDSNRDHVPTRGLLNPPYPENLPVVEVCRQCNAGVARNVARLASSKSTTSRPLNMAASPIRSPTP